MLGQFDVARALYDADAPDAAKEINTILRADWFWRLPHTVNHAHLTLLSMPRAGANCSSASSPRPIVRALAVC